MISFWLSASHIRTHALSILSVHEKSTSLVLLQWRIVLLLTGQFTGLLQQIRHRRHFALVIIVINHEGIKVGGITLPIHIVLMRQLHYALVVYLKKTGKDTVAFQFGAF